MNCEDIRELSPLWHTNELEGPRHDEFASHLAACPECAAEIACQQATDEALRVAVAAESTSFSASVRNVEERVVRQITAQRFPRWFVPGAIAAAALVAAAILLPNLHHAIPVNPRIFADAARDHTVEVLQQAPRHWRTDAVEIAELEKSQGVPDADVKAIEATGYRLARAKVCRLNGAPYMHLVYAQGNREFSVYLRARGDQSVAEADSATDNLHLASFTRGRLQAVIVSDASKDDCEKFTRVAEGAL